MIKKILLLTFVTVFGMISVNARNINVNGHIILKGKGTKEAAAGASILDAETQRLLGVADEDGKYQITVDSEGEIIFSFMGAEPRQERVKGRHFINVELVPQTKLLEEVFVQAKGGKKSALAVEPTDLDVEGNTLRFKTKVKLPARMFNSSKRLIVQPAILNVTRNRVSFLKPVVFDGWRYAATQERMHDWDKTVDPLSKYQEIKAADNLDNTIYLLDSLYIENPKDDFSGFVIASLENYNKVCYKDTFEVARGTVNPLRFLSYSLTPVNLTEERYLPSPEVELRDTKGELTLIFPVGKEKLD
ncbi:MAG: carboxypeptidase-like regulatory domain-containing protein, partial [Muribaculaceae bacterium]|nr:carboxypeptidase-like regulatory domain-containing protein [Muribaculaceae bacterium]